MQWGVNICMFPCANRVQSFLYSLMASQKPGHPLYPFYRERKQGLWPRPLDADQQALWSTLSYSIVFLELGVSISVIQKLCLLISGIHNLYHSVIHLSKHSKNVNRKRITETSSHWHTLLQSWWKFLELCGPNWGKSCLLYCLNPPSWTGSF